MDDGASHSASDHGAMGNKIQLPTMDVHPSG